MSVHGPLPVAGQDRAQQQKCSVANPYRDRRDERGKPLAYRAQQPQHDSGDLHHPGEGVVVADPARQRLGRGHRRDPRDFAQQSDLSDDLAGTRLPDGHHAVAIDVPDLGSARRDEQEGNGLLALLHQHLAGGGPQRLDARRQGHQVLDRASGEDVHCREFFRAGADQFGHCDIPCPARRASDAAQVMRWVPAAARTRRPALHVRVCRSIDTSNRDRIECRDRHAALDPALHAQPGVVSEPQGTAAGRTA